MDLARTYTRSLLLLVLAWTSAVGMLASTVATAAVPLELSSRHDSLSLDGRLDWWPDAPADATWGSVRAADKSFVPAPGRASFGWRPDPTWFRVTLANVSTKPRDMVLEVGFANHDELDLYVVRRNAAPQHFSGGTERADMPRALPSPRYAFPLALSSEETVTLYLRVVARTSLNLPLALYDQPAYVGHVSALRGWQGLFYGLVGGVLLCVVFLWRSTGDSTFWYYLLATSTAMFFFLGLDGLLGWWFPSIAPWQSRLMFFGACLSVTFTLMFARIFFDSAGRRLRVEPALIGLQWAAAVAALLVFIVPPLLAMLLAILCSLLMAILLWLGAWQALRQKFPPARLLLMAMSVHIVGVGLLAASGLAEIPGLFVFSDSFHRVGFVFLMVCVTVALGQRIRLRDEEHRHAEAIALKAASDAKARNDFQSRMSHELRTPMTGVLGMAELLEQTSMDERQRRYLGTLRYSGEILLNLIGDMLDHAKLESGNLQLRREAFDLLRMVDECRLLFGQPVREDGVSLRTDIALGGSRVVVGDAVRLRQILVNVLQRAFRRARGQAVDWRVQTLPEMGWLRFDIECAGGGQASADDDGLSTSRQLCEAMGGRLLVQSMASGGTLYRLELPLHAAS